LPKATSYAKHTSFAHRANIIEKRGCKKTALKRNEAHPKRVSLDFSTENKENFSRESRQQKPCSK